ncbi:membrane fusion protein (multidrug efflux system) [Rhodovulum imhoffii]|uniref:Membrane fusion protein (Multidrug efflux system) n=1 Tax=Rhodovulum imhoffii TaxID=365340 RepID=A0A2T5BQE7_9RHOB|nr:efflux RND transporter periplasmic adaptor subunit [Rhodovulum imhoffii]MBK5933669.1 efflux transporter periplasmic adaptor subunit [Rhodovulum imhoffii]PTN01351.1 membrane fusion protein (multidrug efflux system) [Rhodovulum imhoffii]
MILSGPQRAPSSHSGGLRRIIFYFIIGIYSISAPVSAQSDEAERPAPAVTVAITETRNFENASAFTGRVEAIEAVELLARVQGYLEARHFEEGARVEKGDLLYELDSEIYRNALNQAQAALQIAQANEKLAQQQFDRQLELTERNVQSRAMLEEAQARLDIGFANVAAAKAKVEEAQINLGYTTIEAPLTGLIGRSTVSVGDLISPQSGVMASIVQTDPVYVRFPVPQTLFIDIRKRGARNEDVFVELTLADGKKYEHHGQVSFADVTANASTDTIVVRATVPNPDYFLVNSGLVDVRVVSNEDTSVLAIPLQALLIDQQGSFVLTVDDEDKVQIARIEEGRQQDGYLEVRSGLEPGARVIVEGIQKASPGIKVAPNAAQPSN